MALKLSEAIRLGSMLRGQAYGYMFARGRSCALGAAMEASGVTYDECRFDCGPIADATASLDRFKDHSCPQCGELCNVYSMVAHLNDRHLWARERIADWVATIEPQPEAELQPELSPVLAHPAVREGR